MEHRRPPGRPPLDPQHPSVKVCLSVPSDDYDAYYAKARRDRVSVPEVIRRSLDPQKRYTK